MQVLEPNCSKRKCKHFLGILQEALEPGVPYCLAYPEGIPDDIAYGDDLHKVKRADQFTSIVYEEETE